jgi:chromate transporter
VLYWFYNLKKYSAIYRSLEGINAAVVGIMIAATFYIAKDISVIQVNIDSLINILILILSFLLLQYTRIASPILVFTCILLGYLF